MAAKSTLYQPLNKQLKGWTNRLSVIKLIFQNPETLLHFSTIVRNFSRFKPYKCMEGNFRKQTSKQISKQQQTSHWNGEGLQYS